MIAVCKGHHYQIIGQDTVFLAVQDHDGLILKDLNRSAIWQTASNMVIGYFEGYRIIGNRLAFVQYDIIGGWHEQQADELGRPDISLTLVRPCGVKTEVISMAEWSPNYDTR